MAKNMSRFLKPQPPIDPADEQTRPWLGNIQGNILKGHGRPFSAFVLFAFRRSDRSNRALLRAAAEDPDHQMTSALKQYVDARKRADFPNRPFRSLALSAAGLLACGYQESDFGEDARRIERAFWETNLPGRLSDRVRWEKAFAGPVHGVLTLACQSENALRHMVANSRTWLLRHAARVVKVEHAFVWRPEQDGPAREPFGFADGFAHPRLVADGPETQARETRGPFGVIRNRDFVHPTELPLSQVLHVKEAGDSLWGSSFMVVRKLEQNVRAFAEAEAELGKELARSGCPFRPKEAGALFIGRERDGTPLVPGGKPLDHEFSFNGDANGMRCPFHAHIRKVNPRQKITNANHGATDATQQRSVQFVRRGVVFGNRDKLHFPLRVDQAPTRGVGLMFVGFMSSIQGQFEVIHRNWSVDPNFPVAGTDLSDPLVSGGGLWHWAPRSDVKLKIKLKRRLVTPRGGLYLLVPPLSWLAAQ
jgi:deferrochelatase/peroxidase EfeB